MDRVFLQFNIFCQLISESCQDWHSMRGWWPLNVNGCRILPWFGKKWRNTEKLSGQYNSLVPAKCVSSAFTFDSGTMVTATYCIAKDNGTVTLGTGNEIDELDIKPGKVKQYSQNTFDFLLFEDFFVKINEQQSPPAWTQEAYRPPRSKYSICCPIPGGRYPIPGRGVPHPSLAEGYHPCPGAGT